MFRLLHIPVHTAVFLLAPNREYSILKPDLLLVQKPLGGMQYSSKVLSAFSSLSFKEKIVSEFELPKFELSKLRFALISCDITNRS